MLESVAFSEPGKIKIWLCTNACARRGWPERAASAGGVGPSKRSVDLDRAGARSGPRTILGNKSARKLVVEGDMSDNEFEKLVDRIDEEYGGPRRVVITFPLLSKDQLAAIQSFVRAAARDQEFLESKHQDPR